MPRGGKRPGAGRPAIAIPLRVTGSIRLTPAEWSALDSYAVGHRLTGRGEAVAALLRAQSPDYDDRHANSHTDEGAEWRS